MKWDDTSETARKFPWPTTTGKRVQARWDTASVDLLTKLWAQGYSASRIAARLNIPVSRNAVIGKVHRLGLAGRGPETFRQRAHQRKPRARPAKPQRTPPRPLARAKAGPPQLPCDPLPVSADVARISFAQLEEHHCRWPVGDPQEPGFGFCGATKAAGLSYCAGHAARAYQSPIAAPKRPAARHRHLVEA